jgi:glucosamine-6-phosphate deaminase
MRYRDMDKNNKKRMAVPDAPPAIPFYPWRNEEVRRLMAIPTEAFLEKYAVRVQVTRSLHHLYTVFAELLAQEVEGNNRQSRPTRIILPVGPTAQYPVLLKMLVESRLSLKDCHFFFMDEYCYEDGRALGLEHSLGFRSTMERLLFGLLEKQEPDLMIPREHIYFPDPEQPQRTQEVIDSVGGIDTCYGGIGIHGHVAFNEPEEGVEFSDTRVLRTNLATKTINMIRANCGGFFGDFPEVAVTIGMRQVLACPRIVLFPRNDVFAADGPPLQCVNAVTRMTVAAGIEATPAGDYPATFCGARSPGNPARTLRVYTTRDALETPKTAVPPIEG